MKLITLTTCALAPALITQNINYFQTSWSNWGNFQKLLKDEKFIKDYNETKKWWFEVLKEKTIEDNGIFIEWSVLHKFYDNFQKTLNHFTKIFNNFSYQINKVVFNAEDKIDQAHNLHRKNPIDFEDTDGYLPNIYKKTLKIFNNLEKAWNLTVDMYNSLNKIMKEQFNK